jgi:hypothetical protein
MAWGHFSLITKITLILMLVSASLPIVALFTFSIILKRGAPIFLPLISIVWVTLFVLSFKDTNYGFIGGIIWGGVGAIFPLIIILKGINPLADLGFRVCPFAAIGAVISATIAILCIKNLCG